MAVLKQFYNMKPLGVVFPQAIKDDADFVGGKDSTPVSVDTKGWNSALVMFTLGAEDATIANMNVYESDNDSTYTEIAGLDFTADAAAVPGAGTDSNKLYACYIDLRDKKRYLQVDLTAGNGASGTYATCHILLGDPDQAPTTDAERGIAESLSA